MVSDSDPPPLWVASELEADVILLELSLKLLLVMDAATFVDCEEESAGWLFSLVTLLLLLF